MTSNKGTPPKWFADIIITGIQRMYAIGIKYRPTDVAIATDLWIETLWELNIAWDKDRDSARLTKGFAAVMAHTSEWCTPAEYMAYVPKREPLQGLPAPEYPREKARENLGRIKEMLKIKPIPRGQ